MEGYLEKGSKTRLARGRPAESTPDHLVINLSIQKKGQLGFRVWCFGGRMPDTAGHVACREKVRTEGLRGFRRLRGLGVFGFRVSFLELF